jgi:predicted transcriptional regulator of viral defense system
MYLNGLSEQEPDIIYVNHEQPKHKANADELVQENIDRSFRNAVRVSHNIAMYQGTRICLLNGMYTGQFGVTSIVGRQNENLRFTGIARTLIDIAVRPVYSGGIENVLRAYRLAKEKVIVG